ncbi:MAG TPA: hypothetical protein VFJ82_02820 [Longimicrobium sp.]|nr:hypothetical protein [Longimicrobium sp.]
MLPPPLRAVAGTLRDLRAPWAIAGGWAIDLALGRVTRPHADVDVAVFRDAQEALRAALPAWEFAVVEGGAPRPWEPGAWLAPPVHEVHARPPAGVPGPALEFLLNERDGADWVYRRDPAVRLPLAQAVRESGLGVWVLAPEIVLLYKSKAPRPADEHDFQVARPLLDVEARAWLRAALRRAAPDHPWADALAPEG